MPASARLPLRTTRLVLRDFVVDDLAAVHAWSIDPEVVRFLFWGPRTPDESRAFLERMIEARLAVPRVVHGLAIVPREGGAAIGTCKLEVAGREGNLGYLLARSAWGQGYATEACRALLAFGFETLGLRRVYATCDVHNIGSQRVLQRLGMQKEREFRGHAEAKGRSWDSYEYAIYPP